MTGSRCAPLAFFAITAILASSAHAQTIEVGPYLQQATPTGVIVMWESGSDTDSMIFWGTSDTLDQSMSGESFQGHAGTYIHEVPLTGLTPDTDYYYRVVVPEEETAETFRFHTQALASDEASFVFAAFSDNQQDSRQPHIFREIIEDGIMAWAAEHYDAVISNALGFVIVPGDLVQTGSDHSHWQDQFFAPAQQLMSQIPFYPALGNHEGNSPMYFDYFHLPDNGTEEYLEHWYYTDYSNVRIIGLDSNGRYTIIDQLNWLDDVLDAACELDEIDFVFAQLHHPYLSEMWVPGETGFTGEVVRRLETFSDDCGKPSIHFFGHTHGYSRGQSRDHDHLWVNVATAGGFIDTWGSAPQADYTEFTVSQPEYGFVVVEVEAGDDPEFFLQRISRGDVITPTDNRVSDAIRVRYTNTPPTRPVGEVVGALVNPDCTILSAGSFSDDDEGDTHMASHWQISADCEDFTTPLQQHWQNSENWYQDVDTQADDDITDEGFFILPEDTGLCFRVRYRDTGLVWSEWSEGQPFQTQASTVGENLLLNAGAEAGIDAWTPLFGEVTAPESGVCDGFQAASGDYFLSVGGLCEAPALAITQQDVSLADVAVAVAEGNVWVTYGGFLAQEGDTSIALRLQFIDENKRVIANSEPLHGTGPEWVSVTGLARLPAGTRTVAVVLGVANIEGTLGGAYADDIFLRLDLEGALGCVRGEDPIDPPTDDAGMSDMGQTDAGDSDAGGSDAGELDAAADADSDAGVDVSPDAAVAPDTSGVDAGGPDVGPVDAGSTPDPTGDDSDDGCSCSAGVVQTRTPWLLLGIVLLLPLRRKRRARSSRAGA